MHYAFYNRLRTRMRILYGMAVWLRTKLSRSGHNAWRSEAIYITRMPSGGGAGANRRRMQIYRRLFVVVCDVINNGDKLLMLML